MSSTAQAIVIATAYCTCAVLAVWRGAWYRLIGRWFDRYPRLDTTVAAALSLVMVAGAAWQLVVGKSYGWVAVYLFFALVPLADAQERRRRRSR